MFKKTFILQRRRRIIVIFIVLIALTLLAFSPLVLGLVMMALEEAATGKNVGEHNSVWGVLPWLSFGTMVIFLPPAFILLKITVVGVLYDLIVLLKRSKEIERIERIGKIGTLGSTGSTERCLGNGRMDSVPAWSSQ